MKESATIKDLRDALIKLCEKYPEVSDKVVHIPIEGGYCGVKICAPIVFYGEPGCGVFIHSSDEPDVIKMDEFQKIYDF